MSVPIKEWSIDDRPREKLESKGSKYLSDAELLAIIINTGTRNKSALDLAKQILIAVDNDLSKLTKKDFAFYKQFDGIGRAKAVTISAAIELGSRFNFKKSISLPSFRSPEEIAQYILPEFLGEVKEKFVVLLLNSKLQVIRKVEVSVGSSTKSIVEPLEVFKQAILENSTRIVAIHNHPSGDPTPSQQDITVTNKLIDAGRILNIELLDHIIIASENFYSFRDNMPNLFP